MAIPSLTLSDLGPALNNAFGGNTEGKFGLDKETIIKIDE